MAARVVLVGAGHAHMEALRQAGRFRAAGVDLVLIDPGAFWYSGAATGMLSGALDLAETRVEPGAVDAQVHVHAQRAARIDLTGRAVVLEDGSRVAFDVLSLNTGSGVADTALTRSGAAPVKPVSNLARVREQVEAVQGRMRLAVAGTGATGVETALALAALQRRLGAPVSVVLAGPDPLLPGWPGGAARTAARVLKEAWVERLRARAENLEAGALVAHDGKHVLVDLVVAATGLEASLPDGVSVRPGGLPVGPDLAWVEDPTVFAIGDCAELTHAPRPKLGVFGVRAAPVLIDNLIAAARGDPERRRYQPQRRWLSLMDLGDGTALGRYGGLSHRSALALALKRHLDGAFVRRYQP